MGEVIGPALSYTLSPDGSVDVIAEGEYYGQTFEINIRNNHATRVAILTDAELQGKIGFQYNDTSAVAQDDDSIIEFGEISRESQLALENYYQGLDVVNTKILRDALPRKALRFSFFANKDLETYRKVMQLTLSDRIYVNASEPGGVGIEGDFFIERITGKFYEGNKTMEMTFECSEVAGSNVDPSGEWLLGITSQSELGFSSWLS